MGHLGCMRGSRDLLKPVQSFLYLPWSWDWQSSCPESPCRQQYLFEAPLERNEATYVPLCSTPLKTITDDENLVCITVRTSVYTGPSIFFPFFTLFFKRFDRIAQFSRVLPGKELFASYHVDIDLYPYAHHKSDGLGLPSLYSLMPWYIDIMEQSIRRG